MKLARPSAKAVAMMKPCSRLNPAFDRCLSNAYDNDRPIVTGILFDKLGPIGFDRTVERAVWRVAAHAGRVIKRATHYLPILIWLSRPNNRLRDSVPTPDGRRVNDIGLVPPSAAPQRNRGREAPKRHGSPRGARGRRRAEIFRGLHA